MADCFASRLFRLVLFMKIQVKCLYTEDLKAQALKQNFFGTIHKAVFTFQKLAITFITTSA